MHKHFATIFRFTARFRRDERGVQLAEVAIVLPVLLILLAATAEFGRYFYVYSTLSRATRTAVRYISSNTFTSTANGDNATAINLALCGSTAACSAGTEILSGLSASNFQITKTGEGIPETITVEIINYTYTPIFNLGNFADGVTWTSDVLHPNPKTTMRYMNSN